MLFRSVAICTDHPEVPEHYLLMSARLAVEHGMEPQAALRAITIEAAKICEISDRVGSIEAGKDADILLFDREPLECCGRPSAVILNGKKVR